MEGEEHLLFNTSAAASAKLLPTRAEKPGGYFYLLVDTAGYFSPDTFELRLHLEDNRGDPVPVKKGTLLQLPSAEAAQASLPQILLQSSDVDGIYVKCDKNQLHEISKQEWEMLIAVTSLFNRDRIHRNKDWLREGISLEEHDQLLVSLPESDTKAEGLLRYKGRLQKRKGTWFGIELLGTHCQSGDSSGVFEGMRYFTCSPKGAVFVNLAQIRKAKQSPVYGHRVEEELNARKRHSFPRGASRRMQSRNGTVSSKRRNINKEVLIENKAKLTDLLKTDSEQLANYLLIQNVIDEDSMQILSSTEDAGEKTRMLLDVLISKAGRAFDPFLGTLDMMEKEYASRLLRETREFRTATLPPEPNEDVQEYQGLLEAEEGFRERAREREMVQRSSSVPDRSVCSGRYPNDGHGKKNRNSTSTEMIESILFPEALDPADIDSSFELGSLVEANRPNGKAFGVIRWIGHTGNKSKPIAGIELEQATKGGTDGSLGKTRLFNCQPYCGIFVPLDDCQLDTRFGAATPQCVKKKRPACSQREDGAAGEPSHDVAANTEFSSSKNQFSNSIQYQLGDKVQVHILGKIYYGQVKWSGQHGTPPKDVVGLEMDTIVPNGNEGFLGETRLFTCRPRRGYFVLLEECYPRDRTSATVNGHQEGAHESIPANSENPVIKVVKPQAVAPEQLKSDLQIGSRVEVTLAGKARTGVLRWCGHVGDSDKAMAGIEMDTPLRSGNDGVLAGTRVFSCPVGKGFFFHLSKCRRVEDKPDQKRASSSMSQSMSAEALRSALVPQQNSQRQQAAPANIMSQSQLLPAASPVSPVALDPADLDTMVVVGSVVEVTLHDGSHSGTVRWIGHSGNPHKPMAGLEMETEMPNGNDGTLGLIPVFTCAPRTGIFVPLSRCRLKATTPTSMLDGTVAGQNSVEEVPSETEIAGSGKHQSYPVLESSKPLNAQEVENSPKLGCRVQLNMFGKTLHGTVRWIGQTGSSSKPMAGLELEEDVPTGNTGILNGQKLFSCLDKRGLFVLLSKCQPVT